MNSAKVVAILYMIFAGYCFLGAEIKSDSFRIFMLEYVNVSNSDYKTSFSYSMLGNTVSLGLLNANSQTYSTSPGIVNSWRPPQDDVKTAHTYPNPCNIKDGCDGISFTRLTVKCDIKVYTVSGEEVITINKNSNLDTEPWDLRNKYGQKVSSGLYIFFVKGSDGSTRTGKILIIR